LRAIDERFKKKLPEPVKLEAIEALSAMITIGMRPHIARRVLAEHGVANCRRQLSWLPYRPTVERPEAYLYCAIRGDYPEPRSYAAVRALEKQREQLAAAAEHERAEIARRRAETAAADELRRNRGRFMESLARCDREKLENGIRAEVIARGVRYANPLFEVTVRCALNARIDAMSSFKALGSGIGGGV